MLELGLTALLVASTPATLQAQPAAVHNLLAVYGNLDKMCRGRPGGDDRSAEAVLGPTCPRWVTAWGRRIKAERTWSGINAPEIALRLYRQIATWRMRRLRTQAAQEEQGPRACTSTQKRRPCCASQTGLSPTWPRESTRHSRWKSSLTRPRARPRQPLHPAEAGEIVEALDSLSRAVSDL